MVVLGRLRARGMMSCEWKESLEGACIYVTHECWYWKSLLQYLLRFLTHTGLRIYSPLPSHPCASGEESADREYNLILSCMKGALDKLGWKLQASPARSGI